MTDARTELGLRQAELLAHLLTDAPAPAGFDRSRLTAQASALRAKHDRMAAKGTTPCEHRFGEGL